MPPYIALAIRPPTKRTPLSVFRLPGEAALPPLVFDVTVIVAADHLDELGDVVRFWLGPNGWGLVALESHPRDDDGTLHWDDAAYFHDDIHLASMVLEPGEYVCYSESGELLPGWGFEV